MKKWFVMSVLAFAACGSTGGASGGDGGGGGPVSGKQLTDEQLCREDSPCPGVVGSQEDYDGCMSIMVNAAQDPCRQAMASQRVCVVGNTQCNAEGMPDEAASTAAWDAHCMPQVKAFESCCAQNPTSVFCGE